jgi:quercetin dioxygenase-like cupin family protein
MTKSQHMAALLTILGIGLAGSSLLAHAQNDPYGVIQLLPEDIKFAPNPAGLGAASPQTKALVGDAKKAAPYTIRVKLPANTKLAPHSHPDEWRMMTVLSGTLYFAYGEKFDEAKLKALPPGSFFTEPKNAPHFAMAKTEDVILQVTAMGPSGTNYVNPADDPRKK